MQERYCECGRAIRVSFSFRSIDWQPVYWAMTRLGGGKVHVCPNCGQGLDINRLS